MSKLFFMAALFVTHQNIWSVKLKIKFRFEIWRGLQVVQIELNT